MSQIDFLAFTVHNIIRNYLEISICGGKQCGLREKLIAMQASEQPQPAACARTRALQNCYKLGWVGLACILPLKPVKACGKGSGLSQGVLHTRRIPDFLHRRGLGRGPLHLVKMSFLWWLSCLSRHRMLTLSSSF